MAESVKKKVAAKPKAAAKKAGPAKSKKAGSTTKTATGPQLVKPAIMLPAVVPHDEIEKLAHRFWAERGYQHGSAETDWLRAERELRDRAS